MLRLSSQARLPRYQPLPSVTPIAFAPVLQQRGDVVGLVLQALVVAGPARREDGITDALAVDGHLVEAVARHVGAGAFDVALQRELAPQHRRRARDLGVLRQIRLDPARLPVGGLQQAHLPERRRRSTRTACRRRPTRAPARSSAGPTTAPDPRRRTLTESPDFATPESQTRPLPLRSAASLVATWSW